MERYCIPISLGQLRDIQKKGIEAVCLGNDVFVGTKTGSGKSLIYECIPIIYPHSVTVIVTPLMSIMKEQTERLCSLGFKAIYLNGEIQNAENITSGNYDFVFGNPEALVGERKWRNMISELGKRLKLLVVDEAHTVIQWGTSDSSANRNDAFREWFSHIGELRAICPHVPMAALTATSAPSMRRKIMKILCLKPSAIVISESPDRENIKISCMCITNNSEIEENFSWLLADLETQGEYLTRHIIFSESISNVSKIYAIFRKCFGIQETYEMYHSKTVDSKKEAIRADMSKDGKIRVLICTNSAGMGVNFYGIHNIIHFGLPREMDTLVQQMGRAGRDGVFSNELIIFKCDKGHLKKTEEDLVHMVKGNKCRREVLCTSYGNECKKIAPLHLCCDICEKMCDCGEIACPLPHPALEFDKAKLTNADIDIKREVSKSERTMLGQKLESLKFRLSNFAPILHSDLTHGLTDDVILYIVDHVDTLFTPEDILQHCPIWSYDVACQISAVIKEVFGDDSMYDSNFEIDDEVEDDDFFENEL